MSAFASPVNIAPIEVPVLCYHQVRNREKTDSKSAATYIVPPQQFREQLKMLHDSGYYAVSPEQLVRHLLRQEILQGKPVLLTFDDGTSSQYINALPALDRYNYKAVFFIMTVTLDRAGYLTRKQVKALSEQGHTIGCHTWDHHDVRGYRDADWTLQLTGPTKALSEITGKEVKHFAYPFGAWNSAAIEHLQKQGYTTAFQLSGKQDSAKPMYTIRRIIVDGHWTPAQLDQAIKRSFR